MIETELQDCDAAKMLLLAFEMHCNAKNTVDLIILLTVNGKFC
jgi:hypothetical protein